MSLLSTSGRPAARTEPCGANTSRSCNRAFSSACPRASLKPALPRHFCSPQTTLLSASAVHQTGSGHGLGTAGRRRGCVRAAAAAEAAAAGPRYGAEDLPQSAEESMAQAVEALLVQLGPKKAKKGKKGKKGGTGFKGVLSLKKLSVEVPVMDQSASSQLKLANDILSKLPRELGLFNVVFGDPAAAAMARDADSAFAAYSLEDCFDEDLEGPLLVVESSYDQGALVEKLMGENWSGLVAIQLNAGWMTTPSPELLTFARTFDTVYCFQPLAVQVFMGTQEGAVFKWVRQGNAGGTKWQIFVSQDDELKCVGQQARRPGPDDIETALYNAMAAESPITKGIKGVRGLFDKVSGGGKKE